MQAPMLLAEGDWLYFLEQHQLPEKYRMTAETYFLPLAEELTKLRPVDRPLLLGINGAQGTGKSTLASFLKLATTKIYHWNVAVLSIDDFYLTRGERARLAQTVHPLLATRGVPGTHDLEMLQRCLDSLRNTHNSSSVTLPRFDKSRDERAAPEYWPVIKGTVDLVILEGWCVSSQCQSEADLTDAVNELEARRDIDLTWRRYANNQLREGYRDIFKQLDQLVFLKAPSFEAIFRWRLEQEEKLAARSGADSAALMNEQQIVEFMQHYERITRVNLATMNEIAQFVFELDETHAVAMRRK